MEGVFFTPFFNLSSLKKQQNLVLFKKKKRKIF